MSPKKDYSDVATGLFGPYLLSEYEIQHNLIGGEIGVYALGYSRKDGVFYIDRVGRSDKNLAVVLIKYEGMYKEFKFKFYATQKASYGKECDLFHTFSPPDNPSHPSKPKGTQLRCQVCGL